MKDENETRSLNNFRHKLFSNKDNIVIGFNATTYLDDKGNMVCLNDKLHKKELCKYKFDFERSNLLKT